MNLSASLALVAMTACSYLPDPPANKGLPAPNLERRWLEAAGLHVLYSASGYQGKRPESVEMLDATLAGKMGMNLGWFHPSESRLGWKWLAGRMDADRDGQVTRDEFRGPPDFFDRLDRDRDGVLTEADFDWSSPKALADMQPKKKEEKKDGKGGGRPSLDTLLTGLVTGEIGSPYEGPRVGKAAPLFTLPTHDGKRTIALADHIGEKPVVLIFGSFT